MTVILVDPRRPALVPVDAVDLLAGDVQYTEEMPIAVQWSLPSARSALLSDEPAPVLLSSDPTHPAVRDRLAAGEKLIAVAAARPGERLLDAVEVMDRLRTSGPWESESTWRAGDAERMRKTSWMNCSASISRVPGPILRVRRF